MNTVLDSYGQLCGCPEILKKSGSSGVMVGKKYPQPLCLC